MLPAQPSLGRRVTASRFLSYLKCLLVGSLRYFAFGHGCYRSPPEQRSGRKDISFGASRISALVVSAAPAIILV